jgi:hypothetical protein
MEDEMTERTCPCGSDKPNWILTDARGIYVARVCEDCEDTTRAKYRPDIFTDPGYWHDEPIEEDL